MGDREQVASVPTDDLNKYMAILFLYASFRVLREVVLRLLSAFPLPVV